MAIRVDGLDRGRRRGPRQSEPAVGGGSAPARMGGPWAGTVGALPVLARRPLVAAVLLGHLLEEGPSRVEAGHVALGADHGHLGAGGAALPPLVALLRKLEHGGDFGNLGSAPLRPFLLRKRAQISIERTRKPFWRTHSERNQRGLDAKQIWGCLDASCKGNESEIFKKCS